jgi:hypothetical protein
MVSFSVTESKGKFHYSPVISKEDLLGGQKPLADEVLWEIDRIVESAKKHLAF